MLQYGSLQWKKPGGNCSMAMRTSSPPTQWSVIIPQFLP